MIVRPGGLKHFSREPKAQKYRNRRVQFRGMSFDSVGERDRYIALLQDQEAGRISDLERQVRFPLVVNGVTVCHYVADFQYVDKNALLVVEDFKGVATDIFKLKAKMFKAQYGFDITITRRKTWAKT